MLTFPNNHSKLGVSQSSLEKSSVAVKVEDIKNAVSISLGYNFSCAKTSVKFQSIQVPILKCWGHFSFHKRDSHWYRPNILQDTTMVKKFDAGKNKICITNATSSKTICMGTWVYLPGSL